MKTVIFLFLVSIGLASAQAPRMTVRNADGSVKTLVIKEADISVRILGDVAETVFELDFRNDSDRAVEGEFALKLPEGATVSGYALEVNGAMRAAVSVEKERARTAYETVKRRLIDPGIVEREAANIYRTQVYPVPAKGTKRLRISYTETLAGKIPAYSLPLDFPDPLGSFRLKIEGDGFEITDPAGVDFSEEETGVFLAEKEAFKPTGTLRVKPVEMADALVILGEGEQPPFMLSALPPDLAPRERSSPESVALIWDASGSLRGEDRSKELAVLEAWFEKLDRVNVSLFALRDTMEEAGRFEVRGGKWEELRKAIQSLDCDGATDFSRINITKEQADIVLLITDGTPSLGGKPSKIECPWFFIHSADISKMTPLGAMAFASGGDEIAVSSEDAGVALKKLTRAAPRLISVSGFGFKQADIGVPLVQGRRFHIFGTMRFPTEGTLEIRYGYGAEAVERQTVSYQRGGKSGDLVRRLHAQAVLAGMERKLPIDRAAIIEHCKLEGLVSDFTSLIVLERLQDYAEHGIRPPEEELWEAYYKLAAKFRKSCRSDSKDFPPAWRDKLAWYAHSFPGYERLILPRVKQVGIWKKAVESQFTPEQRDAEAFGVIAGWYENGITQLKRIPWINTAEGYEEWRKEIDNLHKQGAALEATPRKAPPAGKELAVSVRGLVAAPAVLSSEKPVTLRGAIDMAGGLHPFGSLDNIALYRNSGKIIYNTLSDQFTDFPLLPMDMVVVGTEYPPDYSDVDPFSDSDTNPSPTTAPAIRQQGDVWITLPERSSDKTLGGKPSARGGRILPLSEISDEILDIKKFTEELTAGGNPESVYRRHRGDSLRNDHFHIEAARVLFARKKPALAKQVLSNLSENRPGDFSALRSHAFWLAEFGEHDEAISVLEAIPRHAETELLVEIDLAALRISQGDFKEAYQRWLHGLKNLVTEGELAVIALTDFNALRTKVSDAGTLNPLARFRIKPNQHLPADLRITLTCADDTAEPHFQVTEPGGDVPCLERFSNSPIGGRIIGAKGVREYMIRNAVPGTYRINCRPDVSTTLRLTIHTNWGRPSQTTRTVTLHRETTDSDPLAEVEFEFQAAD